MTRSGRREASPSGAVAAGGSPGACVRIWLIGWIVVVVAPRVECGCCCLLVCAGCLPYNGPRSGNLSHIPIGALQVLSVRWKGNSLWGFIEVLDTPSGRLIRHLYERGCKLGVSSRGWASLREIPGKPYKCIMDNFELITFDFVTEPSTRGAWLLPYAGRFSAELPEQRYAEAVSRLGVGAVLPEQFPLLPHLRDVHSFLQDYLSHLKRVRPALLPGAVACILSPSPSRVSSVPLLIEP